MGEGRGGNLSAVTPYVMIVYAPKAAPYSNSTVFPMNLIYKGILIRSIHRFRVCEPLMLNAKTL